MNELYQQRAIVSGIQSNATSQAIIIIPNSNVTPVPPNVNSTNANGSGCCNEVVYEIITGKILEDPNYLNGTYVSQNQNPIPDQLISQNVLNLPRYASGIQTGLTISNESKLSIVNNLNIYFWVYPIYTGSLTKPITLCTKGNLTSFGEYTCQIATDKKLQFSFTASNGQNVILKSARQIAEKVLTFVSIIKTTTQAIIYLNGRLDAQRNISSNPSSTNNPLIIGTGYNTFSLNGYLDNFMINNVQYVANSNIIGSYLSYVPSDYLYQFLNGKITFNGYNFSIGNTMLQPFNIYDAQGICTLLENYTNGFTYDNDTNDYLFYESYENLSGPTLDAPTIYNKLGVIKMNYNVFTRLRTTRFTYLDTEVLDPILLNGYIKTFTGETFYFINGEAYEYDTMTKTYVTIELDDNKANYLLFTIPQNIAFKVIDDIYLFYVYTSEFKSNDGIIENRVVKKCLRYTLGDVSTVVDFSSVSEAGTWTFYSQNKFLNTSNPPIVKKKEKNNIVTDEITVVNKSLERRNISNCNCNEDLENIIYVYEPNNMNIMNLINRNSDYYLSNTIPTLFSRIRFEVFADQECDIVELLLKNQVPFNKFIIIDMNLLISPGIYNLSIISNTLLRYTIKNRDYTINTLNPQHLLFHKGAKPLEFQIQLDWVKISQMAKFIIVEA